MPSSYDVEMDRRARHKLQEQVPQLQAEIAQLRDSIDQLTAAIKPALEAVEHHSAETRRMVDKVLTLMPRKGKDA